MLKQDYHLQEISLPKKITNVKIKYGTRQTITTTPKKLTIWNNKLINNTQNLQAPIKKGQRIGSIKLTSPTLKTISNEPLTYSLYSNETVQKGNLLEILFN